MHQSDIMTSEPSVFNSYDAERGLISSCRDEDDQSFEVFAKAVDAGITADHFSNLACKQYWHALCLAEKEGDFGSIGAMQRLPKDFNTNHPHFFSEVLTSCETSFHGPRFIGDLIKAKTFRDLMDVSSELSNRIYDSEKMTDPMELAIKAEEKLEEMIRPESKTLMNSTELADHTIKAIEKEINQGGATYVPHLPWLRDGLNGGFRGGQLVVVAARPSIGKTTLALNFAYNAGLKGKKTLIFSMEMTADQMARKLATIHAGKSMPTNTPNPQVNRANASELIENVKATTNLPIFLDEAHDMNMGKVRAISKIMKRKSGLDAIVIDYLGLLRPEDSSQIREQQVAQISKACKVLSKELDIVVFLVCQLNRDSSKGGGEPQLHHLRESGQIEQDADIVILLHRELLGEDKKDVKVIVAKNRFGGCGHSNFPNSTESRVRFETDSQRFVEIRQNKLNDEVSDITDYPVDFNDYGEEPRI